MTFLVDRVVVYRWAFFGHAFWIQSLRDTVLGGNIFRGNLSITVILCWVPANTPWNVHVVLLGIRKNLLLWGFIQPLVFADHWNFHLKAGVAYEWLGNLFVLKRASVLLARMLLLINFLVIFGVLKVGLWPIFWRKILTKLSWVRRCCTTFVKLVVVLHTNKIISVLDVQFLTEHIDSLLN